MKLFLAVVTLIGITSSLVKAQSTGDITVSQCSKNPSALYVEMTGASAFAIYSFFSREINVPIRELGGTMMNNMNCIPTNFVNNQPTGAKCSYLMIKGKNIAYPQVDPGFSGQARIECN